MSLFRPKFIEEVVPITKQQERTARSKAKYKWRSYKWNLCIHFAVLFGVFGSGFLIHGFIEDYLGKKFDGFLTIFFAISFYVCLWMAFRLLQYCRFAPHYRLAVRELGYDVCVGCGYWMRGLDRSVKTCPECGYARTFLYKHKSSTKWSKEDRKRLRAIGFDQCIDCTAIFSMDIEVCPECSKQREPIAEECGDKLQ